MSIESLLAIDDTSLLLIAPPAWGKTQLVVKLVKEYEGRVVYVSPLRALAAEFYYNIENEVSTLYREGKLKSDYRDYKLIVTTAELLLADSSRVVHDRDALLVIDELHLFYLWGESFRERLLDFLEYGFIHFSRVLSLSATVSDKVLENYNNFVSQSYQNNYLLNLGNFELLYKPDYIFNFYLFSEELKRVVYRLFCKAKRDGCLLIFVKYRKEVEEWLDWAKNNEVNALGCVGGEASEFSQKLCDGAKPRLIIGTKVLSHGVNLPILRGVLFSYDEPEAEMRLQMLARGGRRGESFFVAFPNNLPFKGQKSLVQHGSFLVRKIFSGIRGNYFK